MGERARTIAEKLLSRAAGADLRAGDIAICVPDIALGTDGSIPMALDYLRRMQPEGAPLPGPKDAGRVAFAFDHYGADSGGRALALQQRARAYAREHAVRTFDVGEGVGHQLLLECGLVRAGMLAVAADSHATSYGALNAFGTGIGSSDFAGILQCGQVWLKVPASLRIRLAGALPRGVAAKDLALALARRLGAEGANSLALEFHGPGVARLDMDDRFVVANMAVEMGAKAALFPFDDRCAARFAGAGLPAGTPTAPDEGADYVGTVEVDLSELAPQVALPHRVDQVVDLAAAPPTKVDMVYLGTCTGGRVKDFDEALAVLRAGGGVAPGVRLVVTPASANIRDRLAASGALAQFAALGAEINPPGCGACCGTCGRLPEPGMNVVSTANRNFKGRMGRPDANIYLASPAACASAAVHGRLVDPREEAP